VSSTPKREKKERNKQTRTWFVSLPVCDHSQGVYFPPNRRRSIVFRVLFEQTNKQTNKQRTHTRRGKAKQTNKDLHTRRAHVRAVRMYHTHLALCASCVCLAKNMMTMHQQFSRLRCAQSRFTSIKVVAMSMLCLFSLKHDDTPLLLCVHAVSVLLKT